jgi:hypothetical protein
LPPVLVVLGFGAGAGVVTGGLKAARTSMLSWLNVLVVLGFGAGAGVVPAFLKATKTVSLSRPWLIGLLGAGDGAGTVVVRCFKAARTSMLSRPWFEGVLVVLGFGAGAGVVTGGLKAARTSILSSPCIVLPCLIGVGFGFATGAAKAFGSTLKPAASVKVKMSFLYKVISLKI